MYEDTLETVKRCIESLKDNVDHIFVIDGKFEYFEAERLLSTDEVREYLVSIPNVILRDAPNLKENEKRQIYFDMCEEYDTEFLLMIDADEYITPDTQWDAVVTELQDHYVVSQPKILGVKLGKGFYPRMWMNPMFIEYTKTHNFWRFKTDGTLWRSSTDYPPIHGIEIKGDDKLRSKEYIDKSYAYQVKLMKYEKPYKEKYRLQAENFKPAKELYEFHGVPMV